MHPSAKWLVGMIVLIMLIPIPAVIDLKFPLLLPYQWHKGLHLLGVIMLLGNLMVSAVWMFLAGRTGDAKVLNVSSNIVNWADVCFTGPGLILIVYNGLTLAGRLGGLYENRWISIGFLFLILTGIVWVGFLVRYQFEMVRLSNISVETNLPLPHEFYRILTKWHWSGIFAILLGLFTIILMVVKPKFI